MWNPNRLADPLVGDKVAEVAQPPSAEKPNRIEVVPLPGQKPVGDDPSRNPSRNVFTLTTSTLPREDRTPQQQSAIEVNTSENYRTRGQYLAEGRARELRLYDLGAAFRTRSLDDLALTERKYRITTRREDPDTVRAIVARAHDNGWRGIEVQGSEQFRRATWVEAQTRGIEARGYAPTDLDRKAAEQNHSVRGLPDDARSSIAIADASRFPTATRSTAQGNDLRYAAPAKAEPVVAAPPAAQSRADDRRRLRDAKAELSSDGRLVLSALENKIDRQVTGQRGGDTAERLKIFVASELVKKEWAEGPVVLSAEQRRSAAAPEPIRQAPQAQPPSPRRAEPDAPSRSIGR